MAAGPPPDNRYMGAHRGAADIGLGRPARARARLSFSIATLLTLAACALAGLFAPSPAAAASLITSFQAGVVNTTSPSDPPTSGQYATQAGSHPAEALTQFTVNTSLFDSLQDARVDLPPGLVVNPQAIPQCNVSGSGLGSCPSDTQVGTSTVTIINVPIFGNVQATGNVYNMVPPAGSPGDFAFSVTIAGLITIRTDLVAGVRWYPSNGQPADYGDYFTISGISNLLGTALQTSTLAFWGAPEEQNGGGATDNAFITNPTVCNGPQTTKMYADTYTNGQTGTDSFTTPVGASGCTSIPFNPSVTVTPNTTQRDQPDGITVDMSVPQDQNPSHIAASELQNATIALPSGLSINPSAGNGLQACTSAQFGEGTNSAIACPAASKVGTATITSPALAGTLSGFIYVGPQTNNTYQVYVDAANANDGVDVRLTGTVTANTSTGQLTATFNNTPQVPFSDFKLKFNTGAGALFANSLACGAAATTTSLVPYSGNAAGTPSSSFTVDQNGAGGSCPSTIPFNAVTTATLGNTTAGASNTLTLGITRHDGDQTLSSLTTQLPAGMLANLTSITPCSSANATAGTCPAGSQIGTTTITAGAGSTPYQLNGAAYLTSGYDGDSLGLAIVLPTVAGPFQLTSSGNEVVRAGVAVDTVKGQITITTDPFPTVLDGVPLRLKTIGVAINQPNFLTNQTTCAAATISGTTSSTGGVSLPFTSPATMGGCISMPFVPTLSESPSTTEADAPLGLTIDLHVPSGDSNLQSAVVTLPAGVSLNPSVVSALGSSPCTAAQLAVGTNNPVGCPAASQVGTVEIDSPLLPTPLDGAIYVGPQTNNTYEIFLDAENATYGISVRLIGSLVADPSTGQLTATFANTPPIPFTDLKLTFDGGPQAPLASPATCGAATTASTLTPTSGSVASTTVSYTVDANGSGGACPSTEAFNPTMSVTTPDPGAGATDPVTIGFASGDQQQNLGSITATLPPGLVGEIGSVPQCDNADATAGTCSSSSPKSQIGTATVSAGVGSSPLQLPGVVYLTGPYGGAPFGLSIVVDATKVGPYSFGTVVVRAAIAVDPHDAHLTITSDALPSILQGVPLRLKAVSLAMNSGFMFNPTSCGAQTLSASIASVNGPTAPAQAVFTPTGCAQLGFSPAIVATLGGSTASSTGASLSVMVTPKLGQGNLQSVSIALPSTISARLSTINQACVAATYQANPAGCPAASDIGSATASTPVLPDPLTGSVYLVAQPGGMPTLGLTLGADGVTIDLSGTIAIGAGGLTTTFAAIPDVPISSFTLALPRGPSSALTTTAALTCTTAPSVTSTATSHSGAAVTATSTAQISGCATSSNTGDNAAGRGAGSGQAKWLVIAVLHIKRLKHHAVRLYLRLPTSGKLTLSSRDIRPVKVWTKKRSRFVWVTISLTRYGFAQMRHHHPLKVKMRAGFRTTGGRSGWVYKSVTLL